jgi:hypothetical protein
VVKPGDNPVPMQRQEFEEKMDELVREYFDQDPEIPRRDIQASPPAETIGSLSLAPSKYIRGAINVMVSPLFLFLNPTCHGSRLV